MAQAPWQKTVEYWLYKIWQAGLLGPGADISFIGGAPLSLGQKAMVDSIPVVIASDQSAVPVSGTVSLTANTPTLDGGPGMSPQYFRSGGATDIMGAGLAPAGGKAIQLIDLIITSDADDVVDLVDGTIDDVLYVVAGVNAQLTPRAYWPPFTINGTLTLTVVGGANVTAYGAYIEV